MPNSFSHLIFGKLYLEKNNLKNINLNNYYFSCIIPDINHICNINRKTTHFYNGTINNIGINNNIENTILNFFKPKNNNEYSFCLGYINHIKIDNLWKYNIRLKYNISLKENLEIYYYLDYYLKEKYNLDYDFFKKYIDNGNCNLINNKLNINNEHCRIWKNNCNYLIKSKPKNKYYDKIIDKFLKLI